MKSYYSCQSHSYEKEDFVKEGYIVKSVLGTKYGFTVVVVKPEKTTEEEKKELNQKLTAFCSEHLCSKGKRINTT